MYYLTDADPSWPAQRQVEHLRELDQPLALRGIGLKVEGRLVNRRVLVRIPDQRLGDARLD